MRRLIILLLLLPFAARAQTLPLDTTLNPAPAYYPQTSIAAIADDRVPMSVRLFNLHMPNAGTVTGCALTLTAPDSTTIPVTGNICGAQGLNGNDGTQGLKGDKGDKGDTGSVGPAGSGGNTGSYIQCGTGASCNAQAGTNDVVSANTKTLALPTCGSSALGNLVGVKNTANAGDVEVTGTIEGSLPGYVVGTTLGPPFIFQKFQCGGNSTAYYWMVE